MKDNSFCYVHERVSQLENLKERILSRAIWFHKKCPSLLINSFSCHSCSFSRMESMYFQPEMKSSVSTSDEIYVVRLKKSVSKFSRWVNTLVLRRYSVQNKAFNSNLFKISLTRSYLLSLGLLKTLDLHLGRDPFPFKSFRKTPIDLSPLCQLATCVSVN